MMSYRGLLVAFLLPLVPATTFAQRPGGMGGRGGMGGPPGAMRGDGAPQAMPSSKDVLKNSPLRLLLDKKKDLSLTDSQKVKLLNRLVELDQALVPAMAQLDSIGKRSGAGRDIGDMSDEDREMMMQQRESLRALMATVHAKEDSTAAVAVAELSEQQQPKARELVEKRREEIRKRESRPEPRMGGPGRGGPGRPGMRPPEALD